ncbi:MAG: inorganic phosphate transporter [Cytophagia bacterium]|nr:inorganic phosphate transporter [Cytophagia bacterium]
MDIFSVFLVILFITALVDLIVGVSNDAVNFLNSAIGSRVASVRVILTVASVGILLGSVFSNGMMEVARNGLFNPEYFTFREVMYIFLAVMITDIILLDIYNNLGLPTSTTVSLVFELLGAAFIVGTLTSLDKGIHWFEIPFHNILNFSSAITIVSGIFLSIFLAFIVGSAVQYLSRLVFTFSLNHSLKKYGAVFSGLAITTIFYFLLIKGAKGSAFVSDTQAEWVMNNSWAINIVAFLFWSIAIQLLLWFTTVNPLRIVVLLGTFALAMAFASNDLVNFIGVAIGGLVSFQSWQQSGISADVFNMGVLNQELQTPAWILLVAGVVMVLTLWFSAKSRKVTETEVSLGRQDDGDERFKSTWLSRFLVGGAIYSGKLIQLILPRVLVRSMAKRFTKRSGKEQDFDKPSFDLVRASVNLLVASVLIAFGTSMKLPLSTTFVSFMVAMGSSFADKAWGRESAVYRVAGVMQVIAGWLLTALIAFLSSALLVFIIYKTNAVGVFSLTVLAAFLLIRSHIVFSIRQKKEHLNSQDLSTEPQSITQVIEESKQLTIKNLRLANKVYVACIEALTVGKRNNLSKSLQKNKEFWEQNSKLQNKIIKYVRRMPQADLKHSRLYILLFNHIQDLHQSVRLISESCLDHLDNYHTLPSTEYVQAVKAIETSLTSYIERICEHLMQAKADQQGTFENIQQTLTTQLSKTLDLVISDIQQKEVGNRIGRLQTKLLLESKDIQNTLTGIYNLYKDIER